MSANILFFCCFFIYAVNCNTINELNTESNVANASSVLGAPKAIDDYCNYDYQCYSDTPNSICLNNYCKCKPNYKENGIN